MEPATGASIARLALVSVLPWIQFLFITTDMVAVYIAESAYVVVLGLIKVSLIMFYLQIFDQSRNFRIAAYSILTFIIINNLIIFFLTIFSCKPVDFFWDRDLKGTCLDINALAYANSASAIIQDIVLLILPLAMISNLNMKRYRKIAVGLMFSIGTLYVQTT